jgi:hypothetical protein
MLVWAGILILMLIGAVGGLTLLVLWWARKPNIAVLIAVTVAVAMFLFVLFRIRCGEQPGYGAPPTVWVIGLRLFAVVLAGVVLASILYLVWRFFAWLGAADPAGGAVNPEERKRILGMVEQGKMTGVEGAELLDALGKSSALRGQQTFGRLDVTILVAVAVVTLGFFLPWVQLTNQGVKITGELLPSGVDIYRAGYQAGPVGWAVLISVILAALLVFITPKDYLYKLVLLQVLSLCVGLALAVSVWWSVGANVSIGLVICVPGFGLALAASGMKLKALGR